MAFTWVRPDGDQQLVLAGAPIALPQDDPQRAEFGRLLTIAFNYLKDHAPSHLGLAPAITEMLSAVADYQSRQPVEPAARLRPVLKIIQDQRNVDPTLPVP